MAASPRRSAPRPARVTPAARRPSPDQLPPRTAMLVGWGGYAAAAILPVVLWYRPIGLLASDPRLEAAYLSGWLGYALIVLGLAFFLPVALSIGRRPESRLYPRSREAYAGWGITLYLLGMVLASQVAQIARGPAGP